MHSTGIAARAGAAAVRAAAAGIATALLALSVGGCDGWRFSDSLRLSDEEALRLSDPVRRHPIGVEAQRASVELPVGPGHHGITSSAYLEATRFVRQYKRDGRGPLLVTVPHYVTHDGRSLATLRHVVSAAGIAPRRIRMKVRHDGAGTIALSYDRIVAVAPVCGDWPESITARPEAGPYPSFGCASRRNLANMVAEPTDLLFPAAETSRPSDRRSTPYKEYVKSKSGDGGAGASAAPSKP